MKVKDIISKMVDNYLKISIEVFHPHTLLIKNRYYIKPHSIDYGNIPNDVLDAEVDMLVLHFDSLVISVEERIKRC